MKYILGSRVVVSSTPLANKRFEAPGNYSTVPVLLDLPEHLPVPLDQPEFESDIIKLAWKMHNWLLREWELGKRLECAGVRGVPMEPFASMLAYNWPNCYKICKWYDRVHSDRLDLLVHEEDGVWYFEHQYEYDTRHAPPPPEPVFTFLENAEEELELIAVKLEKLFSKDNPNLVSTVRRLLGPQGTAFMQQMARDYCKFLYPSSTGKDYAPARHLTAEKLLPVLEQLIPNLITEEIRERALVPLKPLEELGAQAKAERERLEQAAGRSAPGPT